MKQYFKFLKFAWPYKYHIIGVIVFNMLMAVFTLFSIGLIVPFLNILFKLEASVDSLKPWALSIDVIKNNVFYHINQIIISNENGELRALAFICILVLFGSLMKNGMNYAANYVQAPLKMGIMKDIRNRIYEKLLDLHLSFYSESKKGDIMSRTSNDVIEVERSIINSVIIAIREPFIIGLFLFYLIDTSPRLTLFVFGLLPFAGYIIGKIGKKLRAKSYKAQKQLGYVLSIIEETLSGLRVIKAFNAEKVLESRFDKENKEHARLSVKVLQRMGLAHPVSEFLGTLIMIVILYYGGRLILSDQAAMDSSDFIGYILIFSQIISPAKKLSSVSYDIRRGRASIERINELLLAKNIIEEPKNPIVIAEFKKEIEYKNVSFKYSENEVLRDVNLKIEQGKVVALVGESGSGKSTMVDLLPRLYDVIKGEILIDGVNIKDITTANLRSLMGIVNQEPILFNDTIYNNIAFGEVGVSEEEVIHAAKVANAHEFIENAEGGYQTIIGDRGSKLSGGQRQRLSIARAVLKNPPILILDEATSALDTESERLVQDALVNLMKNRTSIVIAHRLSTIVHADQIIVLSNGAIVERGTHAELLKKDGVYTKYYQLQMH